jgi:DNA-binding GntR family transcriptional regulator
LVRRQSVHIDRIRRLHLPVVGKAAQIVRDHSAIVKALAEHDAAGAQSALRNHLSNSLAFSDELRTRFPGYFKQAEPLSPADRSSPIAVTGAGAP